MLAIGLETESEGGYVWTIQTQPDQMILRTAEHNQSGLDVKTRGIAYQKQRMTFFELQRQNFPRTGASAFMREA